MYSVLLIAVEAKELPLGASGAMPSPYVEVVPPENVKLDKKHRRSPVRKKCIEPRWEHRWILEGVSNSSTATLLCNDKSVGKHTELGKVNIKVSQLSEGQPEEKFYKLAQSSSKKPHKGRLRVLAMKVKSELTDSLLHVDHKGSSVDYGHLTVVVEQGRNLMACDPNGFSDPYCVLTLGNVVCKTSVKEATLNPVWNEEFELEVCAKDGDPLRIVVNDYDRIGKDDPMGQVVVPLEKLQEESSGWLRVAPQKTESVSGEIKIRLTYVSAIQGRRNYQVAHQNYAKFRDILCASDAVMVCTLCKVHESGDLANALLTLYAGEDKLNGLMTHLIYREISKTKQEANLFRENSMVTKLSLAHLKRFCLPYVLSVFPPLIEQILVHPEGYEVDPRLVTNGGDVSRNMVRLSETCSKFLDGLVKMKWRFPARCQSMLASMRKLVSQKFPKSSLTSVGALLFLRFLAPCISLPDQFKIITTAPNRDQRRVLMLIAKVLQNLANAVRFGEKEAYLIPMNSWIDSNLPKMRSFFKAISTDVPKPTPPLCTEEEKLEAMSVIVGDLHEHIQEMHSEIPKDPRLRRHPEKLPNQMEIYSKLKRLIAKVDSK